MSNSNAQKKTTSIHLLLQQDGAKSGVKSTNTLILQNLAKSTDETAGELGLGNETDTRGFKRAEGNIGEELGGSGRSQVDCSAVVGSGLDAELVDALGLEEFVSSKLEGTLEEVPSECRANTSPDGTEAFSSDDLLEPADKTFVVLERVKLYPRLHAAWGGQHWMRRQQTIGGGRASKGLD
jgi:hypothetical protein